MYSTEDIKNILDIFYNAISHLCDIENKNYDYEKLRKEKQLILSGINNGFKNKGILIHINIKDFEENPIKALIEQLSNCIYNETTLDAMKYIIAEDVSSMISESQCDEYDFFELDNEIVNSLIDYGIENMERDSQNFAELRAECLRKIFRC